MIDYSLDGIRELKSIQFINKLQNYTYKVLRLITSVQEKNEKKSETFTVM